MAVTIYSEIGWMPCHTKPLNQAVLALPKMIYYDPAEMWCKIIRLSYALYSAKDQTSGS